MPFEYKPRVKFFITTKADLATDKVNKWLEENEDQYEILSIQPFMSYTELKGAGGYMLGCMITYQEVMIDPDYLSVDTKGVMLCDDIMK